MKISIYNLCLLIITANFKHFGIIKMQTDNTFDLCNKGFSALEAKKLQFTAKDKQLLEKDKPLLFNGCILSTNGNILQLRQKNQGQKLEILTDAQSYVCQRARSVYIAIICQLSRRWTLLRGRKWIDPGRQL
jgi:hypothetical protein